MSIYGDGASEGIGSSLTAPGGAGPNKGGGVCATVTNGLRSAAAGWCRLVKPVSEKVGVSESAGGSLLAALLIGALCTVGLYFSGAGEAAEEMAAEEMAANSAAVVRSALRRFLVCQSVRKLSLASRRLRLTRWECARVYVI
jgi:hypothetical protein